MSDDLVTVTKNLANVVKTQWSIAYLSAYNYILAHQYSGAKRAVSNLNVIYQFSLYIMPYKFNTIILIALQNIRYQLNLLSWEK